MSTFKHTPKWTCIGAQSQNGRDLGFAVVDDGDPQHPVICEIFPRPYLVAVNRENGNLLSAAPDLLAALEGLLSGIERGQLTSAEIAARAAIAKARGES